MGGGGGGEGGETPKLERLAQWWESTQLQHLFIIKMLLFSPFSFLRKGVVVCMCVCGGGGGGMLVFRSRG